MPDEKKISPRIEGQLRAASPWGRAACKKTVCAGMKTES